MYVVTLAGEFHVYDIISFEKLAELERYEQSRYHWITLNNKQDKALISAYNGQMRLVNITDDKKPVIEKEWSPMACMHLSFQFYPTDDCIIIGAKCSEVGLWYFDEDKLEKRYGHNSLRNNQLPWVGWLDNGRKALSSDSHFTILWNVVDVKRPYNWAVIFKLSDNFFPL